MSTQHGRNVAVMAAIHTHYLTSNGNLTATGIAESDRALVIYSPLIAGVLIMLMTFIMAYVCILMRQKQKRIQEATSLSNLPWVEALEVFTLSGRDAAPGIYLPPATPSTPSPPPAYGTVVQKQAESKEEKADYINLEVAKEEEDEKKVLTDSDGLPSYEAAIKMDGNI